MQGIRVVCLLIILTSATKFALADTEALKILLLRNNCTACHMIDKRKYGPTLKEVAAKYAGDEAALDKLAAKIRAGGTGDWGEDMMPPQPQVSKADALTIARYILALE
jgi:cytochrome c